MTAHEDLPRAFQEQQRRSDQEKLLLQVTNEQKSRPQAKVLLSRNELCKK